MKKIQRADQSIAEVPDDYQLQENEQWDTSQTTDPQEPQQPTQPQPDPNILSAYQQQLLEQSRENQRLQRELENARRVPEQPITPEKEKDFFDKPMTSMAELVRKEMAQQIAPINAFTAQIQRQQAYDSLKNQMRNNAQFPHLVSVEGLLDQIMQSAQQIDANTVIAAYNTALGYYVSNGGQLSQQPNTQAPQTPNRPNVPNPPHIRSSPPSITPQQGRKIRALNENEKKIARFNGFTDEEYLVYTEELSPREVAHITDEELKARIGKK